MTAKVKAHRMLDFVTDLYLYKVTFTPLELQEIVGIK